MLYNYINSFSPWLDDLYHWNFNVPLHLHLNVNDRNDFTENKSQRSIEKNYFLYILMWTFLYASYKNYLNAYLRSLHHTFNRRNHISDALWSFGFISIIILYTVFLWDLILRPEVNVIIIISFYVHFSGIIIFRNNCWIKGLSNLLFILFVFGIPRQSLQPPISSIFILKSIDVLILDICRLLYLEWPIKVKQIYTKVFYMTYCLLWTYLYMVYVPINLLSFYKCQSPHEQLSLWLWFVTQYLDFMLLWLDLIKNCKSSPLMQICIFPSPSATTVYLTKMLEKHKESEKNKAIETGEVKKELWQTLLCAMTMKKKINRLRKSKQLKAKNSVQEDKSKDVEITD